MSSPSNVAAVRNAYKKWKQYFAITTPQLEHIYTLDFICIGTYAKLKLKLTNSQYISLYNELKLCQCLDCRYTKEIMNYSHIYSITTLYVHITKIRDQVMDEYYEDEDEAIIVDDEPQENE